MRTEFLTRAECNALRGVAIIGIFLHNFCHWLPGIIRENEYLFNADNVGALRGVMASPDWNLPLHLLSFFGHYGVPMFLFLSAYGLVMKYEMRPGLSGFGRKGFKFLGSHFMKLFRMMIIGFALFVLVDAITPGRHRYQLLDVVAQLGLFNNLLEFPDGVPGHRHSVIWPGPYWFFGLMMQLYIIYRVLLYRRHWGWTAALMVVCTLVQMLCGPESTELYRLRYNFIGGMLPFGYGLLMARMPMRQPGLLRMVLRATLCLFGGVLPCQGDASMAVETSHMDGHYLGSPLRVASYCSQDSHPRQPPRWSLHGPRPLHRRFHRPRLAAAIKINKLSK